LGTIPRSGGALAAWGLNFATFNRKIEQLKSKLLAMSALVESAIYGSITAVVQKNRTLAEEVLQNESRSIRWRSRSTIGPSAC
jgi:hypothetical protein